MGSAARLPGLCAATPAGKGFLLRGAGETSPQSATKPPAEPGEAAQHKHISEILFPTQAPLFLPFLATTLISDVLRTDRAEEKDFPHK